MKIASWNLEGRLSHLATAKRGTPEKIVEAITALDADVLVHPEAFGTDPAVTPDIEQALADLGYDSRSVAYDDSISRGERAAVNNPYLRVMSRLTILESHTIRPGNLRNMLSVTVDHPEYGAMRILGVHLDDRSEHLRLRQVGPLVDDIVSSDVPTIVMGDFNAMPPDTLKSSLIHNPLFKDIAGIIPHKHIRYTLERLSDMASGTTIKRLLAETSLRNTDPHFTPTTTPKMRRMEWMPSIQFAKIDWILVSPSIDYKGFTVSPDYGADHRALSLEIAVKKAADSVQ